ncbi:MAG: alanine--glyoxylate aminotransferase family protein [Candidatus Kapabacteria bacterium]|nr:alanine--glyoxylate aminotransferase family protein [Candidatus Kapabacteria bacterium]
MKTRLFTPGPTPVPEHVMLRMAQPIIHHRTDEFRNVIRRVSDNLQYLFCTAQPVLTLTSSGTGAMEAAIVNTLSAGDELLFVNGGKFGERWGEIARAYGVTAHELAVPWGTAATAEQVLHMVAQHPATRAVCLTHSETSTGVFTDVRAIAAQLRQQGYEGLVMVDGITAVGAHEMRFDDWGLDVVVTGSQKGLMIPPGLAFIALSQRAWEFNRTSTLPKFYFNLAQARTALQADDTPWTPAITLMLGLDEALQMIRNEGVENVWARHDRLASALRAGALALGLQLFASPSSNAVTSITLPENGGAFMKLLKERYNVTVAAGQESLKGKIFRVSHLGYYDEADMLSILFAMESALSDIGHQHPEGAGLAAAQGVFNQAAQKRQEGA